ncbi:unnamed protein product, partial [Phaeothamnion confervicola]
TSTIQVVPADWNPEQYRRFATERAQPFHDLLGLIEPGALHTAVDLGCGPGELTALAATTLGVGSMVGIDNSPTMLASTAEHAHDGVRFADGDIGAWTSDHDHDLVLASASLQWVPDHAGVLARWTAGLGPGGQLAVQVPANAYMPSHTTAGEAAARDEFAAAFGVDGPPVDPVAVNVLEPEEYASLLHGLGFERQHVRLQVYPHVLPSSRDVVEWVRGTTLTRFEKRLPPELFRRFVEQYEAALLDRIGR